MLFEVQAEVNIHAPYWAHFEFAAEYMSFAVMHFRCVFALHLCIIPIPLASLCHRTQSASAMTGDG